MAVGLIVELTLKPGTRPAFEKRILQHAALCLDRESGCQRFDILVPQECHDIVCAYEVYEDDAALEAHWASDHMAAYRTDVGDMIANRRVSRCDIVSG